MQLTNNNSNDDHNDCATKCFNDNKCNFGRCSHSNASLASGDFNKITRINCVSDNDMQTENCVAQLD